MYIEFHNMSLRYLPTVFKYIGLNINFVKNWVNKFTNLQLMSPLESIALTILQDS
jgi:hypothetical protein